MNSIKQRALKQQRQFFTLVMLAFASFGVWKTLKDEPDTAYILFGVAIGFATLEFVLHPIAVKVFKLWMGFAHILGKIQTTLLTTLLYYFVFVPIGLITKFANRNEPSFETKAKQNASSWVPAEVSSRTPESYYKQF